MPSMQDGTVLAQSLVPTRQQNAVPEHNEQRAKHAQQVEVVALSLQSLPDRHVLAPTFASRQGTSGHPRRNDRRQQQLIQSTAGMGETFEQLEELLVSLGARRNGREVVDLATPCRRCLSIAFWEAGWRHPEGSRTQ